MIGRAGILYGTAEYGGNNSDICGGGCGTVFSLSPPVSPDGIWSEITLFEFTGGNDGFVPLGVSIGKGGAIYGTTKLGGAGASGTVFKLTP